MEEEEEEGHGGGGCQRRCNSRRLWTRRVGWVGCVGVFGDQTTNPTPRCGPHTEGNGNRSSSTDCPLLLHSCAMGYSDMHINTPQQQQQQEELMHIKYQHSINTVHGVLTTLP